MLERGLDHGGIRGGLSYAKKEWRTGGGGISLVLGDIFSIDSRRLAIVGARIPEEASSRPEIMDSAVSLIREYVAEGAAAGEAMTKVNARVAPEMSEGMYITAILVVFDATTRELSVCSAGHNPMVLYRNRERRVGFISPGGIALGFDRGPIFERTIKEKTVRIEQDDRILVYAGGVVESTNAQGQEYGEEALLRFVLRNTSLSSRDFVAALHLRLVTHSGTAGGFKEAFAITLGHDRQIRS
jgi:serine phosphatase RsbU (regulator of sigma subunit)